jgi:exopolysaccharide production protein ExoZ
MIYNIQILRAIAAYLVVFHHIQSHFVDNHSVAAVSNIGIIGVDIFFVISGFIMILTTSGEARSPLSFWRDRLVRIVPLYWLATFSLVGLSLIGLAPTGLHGWDLQDLLASLLFIPEVRADGAGMPILFVGWTLNYEMFFYLLFGLALLLRNQLLSVVALTGLFLGLAIAGRILRPRPSPPPST